MMETDEPTTTDTMYLVFEEGAWKVSLPAESDGPNK